MSDTIKLLRIYTDEAAYFGDHNCSPSSRPARATPSLPGRRSSGRWSGSAAVPISVAATSSKTSSRSSSKIVDTETRLRAFVDTLADLPSLGLATLEAVEVLHSSHAEPPATAASANLGKVSEA